MAAQPLMHAAKQQGQPRTGAIAAGEKPSPPRQCNPFASRGTLADMANNAEEIKKFLRARRDAVRPTQVGLANYPGRRVPGLRREEVAQLAGVSVDYYTRLE